ncbi:putative E3 ubiquitin-protein ligase MARCH [Helianthus anomalus]
MGDHLILDLKFESLGEACGWGNHKKDRGDGGPLICTDLARAVDENEPIDDEEQAPLLATAECRICQEEDSVDTLETPCACKGSLSLLTGSVSNIGATKRVISLVKYATKSMISSGCCHRWFMLACSPQLTFTRRWQSQVSIIYHLSFLRYTQVSFVF